MRRSSTRSMKCSTRGFARAGASGNAMAGLTKSTAGSTTSASIASTRPWGSTLSSAPKSLSPRASGNPWQLPPRSTASGRWTSCRTASTAVGASAHRQSLHGHRGLGGLQRLCRAARNPVHRRVRPRRTILRPLDASARLRRPPLDRRMDRLRRPLGRCTHRLI